MYIIGKVVPKNIVGKVTYMQRKIKLFSLERIYEKRYIWEVKNFQNKIISLSTENKETKANENTTFFNNLETLNMPDKSYYLV